MPTLLETASRVEAAVEAYKSVRDFTNREAWKENFIRESKNAIIEFQRIMREEGDPPPLHPTLAALSMVIRRDEDLGSITRSYPDRIKHRDYDASVVFPFDISGLLPPSKDRWWEHLVKAARGEKAAQNPPPQSPARQQRTRHTLTVLLPPTLPRQSKEGEDAPMAVDEAPQGSRRSGRPKVDKGAAVTTARKRKGSNAASQGASKRRARSVERPDLAGQGSGLSEAGSVGHGSGKEKLVIQHEGRKLVIECHRCAAAKVVCKVQPLSACLRCNGKKVRCSLMPPNPHTGKTDRRPHTEEKLLAFRIDQAFRMVAAAEGKELPSEVRKGKRKRRVRDSPEAGDSEISEGAGQSLPAAKHSGLENLLLKNPPSAHPTHGASKSPAGVPGPSTRVAFNSPVGVTSEVPAARQQHMPANWQVQRSRSDTSPSSDDDDGNSAARIAGLEGRLVLLEDYVQNIDRRVKMLGV